MHMSILLHCFTVHKLQIGYIECKGNVENDTSGLIKHTGVWIQDWKLFFKQGHWQTEQKLFSIRISDVLKSSQLRTAHREW